MEPQQESQDTQEALKQECEGPRTYLGLQSRVCEMGHRVLLAIHHGHFYHRGSAVKALHICSAVVKCYLPLG